MSSDGLSGDFIGAIFVASLIATAGLWWFRMVLKSVRRLATPTRFGVYAAVWLAYFILIIIVIGKTG